MKYIEENEENEPMLLISYKCPKCQHEWQEEWTSACDSECPECETDNIEALDWEEIK
jgi:predicted Zn-ribbon and HTH transcriptional regulator